MFIEYLEVIQSRDTQLSGIFYINDFNKDYFAQKF